MNKPPLRKLLALGTLAALAALTAGCRTAAPEPGPVVRLDPASMQREGIGDFLEFDRYVVLRTPDSLLLSGINKLQRLGGRFYVSDRRTRRAFVFGPTGSMLHVLARHGRSGEEYLDLTDLEAETSPQGIHLAVFDGISGRVLRYAADDGQFLSGQTVAPGVAFKLLGGRTAVGCGNGWEAPARAYRLYDCDGKCLHEAIPFDEALRGYRFSGEEGQSGFSSSGRDIVMTTQCDRTAYRIDPDDGTAAPLIGLDFGKEHRIRADRTFVDEMMQGLHPSFPEGFFPLGDGCMIRYTYRRSPCAVWIGPSGEVLYNGTLGRDRHGLPLLPIPCLDSDGSGELVSMLRAEYLETFLRIGRQRGTDTTLIEELLAATREGDIILLLYRPSQRPSRTP